MTRWVVSRKAKMLDTDSPRNAVQNAIDDGDMLLLRAALAKWPSEISNTMPLGCPLSYACRYAGLEIIQLLLDLGADINLRDSLDFAPLNSACAEGRVEVVKYLLERGAVLDVSNARRNPLF